MDKSAWGDGPWQIEPDDLAYTDEATGLPCRIIRVDFSGTLCGYVGVGKTHPWHGKRLGHKAVDVEVHWGLTFADRFDDSALWFFGFDTSHAFDCMPAMDAYLKRSGIRPSLPGSVPSRDMYRDIGYVKAQVRGLARQLCEVATAAARKYRNQYPVGEPVKKEEKRRRKAWQ